MSILAVILGALLDLVKEAVRDELSPEEVARRSIDAAIASGVPAELLRDHLTQRMVEAAEISADLAQARKTGRL